MELSILSIIKINLRAIDQIIVIKIIKSPKTDKKLKQPNETIKVIIPEIAAISYLKYYKLANNLKSGQIVPNDAHKSSWNRI
jgi:hypothetical protein